MSAKVCGRFIRVLSRTYVDSKKSARVSTFEDSFSPPISAKVRVVQLLNSLSGYWNIILFTMLTNRFWWKMDVAVTRVPRVLMPQTQQQRSSTTKVTQISYCVEITGSASEFINLSSENAAVN